MVTLFQFLRRDVSYALWKLFLKVCASGKTCKGGREADVERKEPVESKICETPPPKPLQQKSLPLLPSPGSIRGCGLPLGRRVMASLGKVASLCGEQSSGKGDLPAA